MRWCLSWRRIASWVVLKYCCARALSSSRPVSESNFFGSKWGHAIFFDPVVSPCGAVAVEVADEIGIVTQLRTMDPCDVVTTLHSIVAKEIVMHSMLFPLMGFHEGQ